LYFYFEGCVWWYGLCYYGFYFSVFAAGEVEGRWRGTVPLRMVSGLRVGDGQLNFVSGSRRTDEVIKWA
jgi:hypothetical protein